MSREKILAICSHLIETDVIYPLAEDKLFHCYYPALSSTNSQKILEFMHSYDGPNGTPLYELRAKFSSKLNKNFNDVV